MTDSEIDIIYKAIPEFTKEQVKEIYDKAQLDEAKKKLWDSLDIIKKIEVIRHTLKPEPQFELPEEIQPKQRQPNKGSVINMENQANKGFIYAIGIGVVVLVVSVMFGISQFVSKVDFTKNIQGMNDVISKAVSGVNDTKTTLTNQIATIPGMITQQTGGMSNQISQLSQQINSVNSDLSNRINTMQSTLQTSVAQSISDIKKSNDTVISSVNTQVKNLSDNITASQSDIQNQINSLKSQVSSLQAQVINTQTLTNISVSGTSNNITSPIPALIITNSNAVTVDTTNMTVILTMTPPQGIVITSPNYTISSNAGLISSTTSILRTTLGTLGVNSVVPGTVTIPAPNISLIATPSANATSSWLAVWSKN